MFARPVIHYMRPSQKCWGIATDGDYWESPPLFTSQIQEAVQLRVGHSLYVSASLS
jgi:hypothetical protein